MTCLFAIGNRLIDNRRLRVIDLQEPEALEPGDTFEATENFAKSGRKTMGDREPLDLGSVLPQRSAPEVPVGFLILQKFAKFLVTY